MEFSHALGFGCGSDGWVLFFVVVVFFLGGGDGFGDSDGGGEGGEGEETEDHVVQDWDKFEHFLSRDCGLDSMGGSSSGINRPPRLD